MPVHVSDRITLSGFTAFLVGIHSQTSADSTGAQIFMVIDGGRGKRGKMGGGGHQALCVSGEMCKFEHQIIGYT